jgi:cell wall-associated NlpC family hydrolase
VAAHRKRKQRPLTGPAGRTALTFALAGAATATAFEGPVHAEPRLTASQVKDRVDKLYQQAEEATEKYNGAKEHADKARSSLEALRDEAARRTERLNTTRDSLGSIATAQYRSGGLGPAVQLALSSSPEQYLEGVALAERAGDRQAHAVTAIRKELAELAELRTRSGKKLEDLKDRQKELAAHKATVQGKLDTAEKLLDQLTAAQRAAVTEETAAYGTRTAAQEYGAPLAARAGAPAARASRSAARGPVRAPSARAAQAVDFAYGALGSPYVWGATGPGSFDCSGLTQAAWRAAGVSLPRTTYTQINAGRRITRDELAPGDLVFFYSGISHVGLYIGEGRMIHAPRPGTAVRIAPIDQMPFAGAVRPL